MRSPYCSGLRLCASALAPPGGDVVAGAKQAALGLCYPSGEGGGASSARRRARSGMWRLRAKLRGNGQKAHGAREPGSRPRLSQCRGVHRRRPFGDRWGGGELASQPCRGGPGPAWHGGAGTRGRNCGGGVSRRAAAFSRSAASRGGGGGSGLCQGSAAPPPLVGGETPAATRIRPQSCRSSGG